MKLTLCLLFSCFAVTSFSQTTNHAEIISFWNSNIQAIIDLDKDLIVEQTNFPLEGSWGYAMELESTASDWTKEDFVANIDRIFDEKTRNILKQKSYNDLVHYKNEEGELIYIINANFFHKDEVSGDTYESSVIFFFKSFDKKLKLYSIEYAG